MQLTHFHDGQNGHMKLTGSHNGRNSNNNNNGSQILRMQAHPGNRGGQVDRGVEGGHSKWCVCTKIVRFLTLNGRKQANLFHKFARWLDATPESSSCCLLPLLLSSPLSPPPSCHLLHSWLQREAVNKNCRQRRRSRGRSSQVWLNLG